MEILEKNYIVAASWENQRNREADQRLCFRCLDSTIPLLAKYKISSLLPFFSSCTVWFVSDLVRIHIVGFSHVAAHIIFI